MMLNMSTQTSETFRTVSMMSCRQPKKECVGIHHIDCCRFGAPCSSSLSKWLLLISLMLLSRQVIYVESKVPCSNAQDCVVALRQGSECLPTGFCSNPFHKGGCLANMKNQISIDPLINNSNSNATQALLKLFDNGVKRVCSSADTDLDERMGYCTNSKYFNYTEIRLMGNNWESVFFETWIVQILLSELLGVPTSVDTGTFDKVVDFYDINDRFEYGKGYDWDALRTAAKVGDCRLVQQEVSPNGTIDNDLYKSCAHVSLEVWEGQLENMDLLYNEGVIEKVSAMGVLGNGGWYIPQFTAERHPEFLSYLGLSGEKNRQKLADAFLRPTKWIDYCLQVSASNCTVPDDVATRPPNEADDENDRYHVDGSYTGYFRKTSENDCNAYPDNCTGHITDFPCGWSSYIQQNTYWLNVSLRSSGDEPICRGYTYTQMVDIWNAANATKSDVMMLWWTPDSLVQTFMGTTAEFNKVALPLPTQECFDHRVSSLHRCEENLTLRIGEPLGACDDQAQPLMKAVTRKLYDITSDSSIPIEFRSPAYAAIENFRLAGLQLGVIFDKWLHGNQHSNDPNPREAVCEWVVENFDLLQSFVPRTYPRAVMDGEDIYYEPSFYVSLIIGCVVLILIASIAVMVYRQRTRRVMIVAQVEFLFLLLIGLLLVQFGSFALSLPPSNPSCIFSTWAVNLGYTLELVPLAIKVSALNRLMMAAKQMKRLKINRHQLLIMVVCFTVTILIYLSVWTAIDPPNKTNKFLLTENVNEDTAATIVEVFSYCQSKQTYWGLIALVWRSLLLVWTTILAFQTRKSPINFNESKTLAIMIYSQFLFWLCCVAVYCLSTQDGTGINVSQLMRYQSLVYSFDVAAVCCIYFIPKLMSNDDETYAANRSSLYMPSNASNDNNNRASFLVRRSTQSLEDFLATNESGEFVSTKSSHRSYPPILTVNDVGNINDSSDSEDDFEIVDNGHPSDQNHSSDVPHPTIVKFSLNACTLQFENSDGTKRFVHMKSCDNEYQIASSHDDEDAEKKSLVTPEIIQRDGEEQWSNMVNTIIDEQVRLASTTTSTSTSSSLTNEKEVAAANNDSMLEALDYHQAMTHSTSVGVDHIVPNNDKADVDGQLLMNRLVGKSVTEK